MLWGAQESCRLKRIFVKYLDVNFHCCFWPYPKKRLADVCLYLLYGINQVWLQCDQNNKKQSKMR